MEVSMKGNYWRKKRKKSVLKIGLFWIIISATVIIAFGMTVYMKKSDDKDKSGEVFSGKQNKVNPEELLITYMNFIAEQKYEEMYEMIDVEESGNISKEDFIKRNSAIYEGIEAQNIKVEIVSYNNEQSMVTYRTTLDTVAGNIGFENEAFFVNKGQGYKLVWADSLIFPDLNHADKVKVQLTQAKRGEISDRNGKVLAYMGVASSVGIVPGKLENRDISIQKIADLLEIEPQEIEKKLSAGWVKDDSFVPIKTIQKVEQTELMSKEHDAEIIKENERQEKLLEISGVMITDTEVRTYPLGEAVAHLVGYVQGVTAEDLEEHAGEGYTANRVSLGETEWRVCLKVN